MFRLPRKLSKSELQQKREELTDLLIERVVREESKAWMKRYMSDPENVNDTHWGFICVFDRYHCGYIEDIMIKWFFRCEALVIAMYPQIFDFDESGEPTFKIEDDMWTMQEHFDYWFNHYYLRVHPELQPVKFPRERVEKIAQKVGYKIIYPDKSEQLSLF